MTALAGWTYGEAMAWLDGHTNFEAAVADLRAPTLDRMRRLVDVMGDPQAAAPVIHLTGTNGKGSTARMVTSLLLAQGLSVGTYTSPDLERVNERLAWNFVPVGDDELAGLLEALAGLEVLAGERLTRFELLTAAAYRWFADVAVDAAVVEVGMGGRWDATNVADAQVAVVTNVSLDHAEVLGPSLVEIAREKAGIVKPASTLVLGETGAEVADVFRGRLSAAVWERGRDFSTPSNRVAHGGRVVDLRTRAGAYDDVFLPVHGAHQGDHAAVIKSGEWPKAIQAYLATISFLDDQVGRLLDGLDNSHRCRHSIVTAVPLAFSSHAVLSKVVSRRSDRRSSGATGTAFRPSIR